MNFNKSTVLQMPLLRKGTAKKLTASIGVTYDICKVTRTAPRLKLGGYSNWSLLGLHLSLTLLLHVIGDALHVSLHGWCSWFQRAKSSFHKLVNYAFSTSHNAWPNGEGGKLEVNASETWRVIGFFLFALMSKIIYTMEATIPGKPVSRSLLNHMVQNSEGAVRNSRKVLVEAVAYC